MTKKVDLSEAKFELSDVEARDLVRLRFYNELMKEDYREDKLESMENPPEKLTVLLEEAVRILMINCEALKANTNTDF